MQTVLPRLVLLSCVIVPGRLLAQSEPVIRCSLQTVDIRSGRIETVYRDDVHFEAPNWLPDGGYFVVNSQGRLFRLATRGDARLEEIPTGFATPVNNDHGFSPDGWWIVVSRRADEHITDPENDWLASSLDVLPSDGSATPEKITANRPSFWHGWSPDGTTLALVAYERPEGDDHERDQIPPSGGPR